MDPKNQNNDHETVLDITEHSSSLTNLTKLLSDEFKEIKNPSHIHPFDRHILPDNEEHCLICRKPIIFVLYRCLPCGFNLCETCVLKPFVIYKKSTHEHPLSIVPKLSFIFTCDACGIGDVTSSLCLCIPCCFTIHWECIDLPRVISINRHHHRVSFVFRIGFGEWICAICCQNVDGKYGGYSCSDCSYVVHSKCATKKDIWDGIELEGISEDDIIPFKVIEDGIIQHFSHEHNLRLQHFSLKSIDNKWIDSGLKECSACALPISLDSNYICSHGCDFVLHKVCANLPKMKRHCSYPQRLALSTDSGVFFCWCCRRNNKGFGYVFKHSHGEFRIDLRCASISNGITHPSHPHSVLVYSQESTRLCSGCDYRQSYTLKCVECDDFGLCFGCITLPNVVNHKYDKHPLVLRYFEKSNGQYWCEICEKKLDSQKWFYTCDECGTTCHIDCVLEAYPYLKSGID